MMKGEDGERRRHGPVRPAVQASMHPCHHRTGRVCGTAKAHQTRHRGRMKGPAMASDIFPASRIEEAYAFDDVLLIPAYSRVLPASADVRTRLTREITL